MARDWYIEDNPASPHLSHTIQPYGDGQWYCLDCDGPRCLVCHTEPVKIDGELCGECISQEAEYWVEYHREGRRPL